MDRGETSSRGETRLLNHNQAKALRDVLHQTYTIHPQRTWQHYPPYPSLKVHPNELVDQAMSHLIASGIAITSVRLNGGAASHILSASKISDRSFNDLDVVFTLATEKKLSEYCRLWEKIRETLMSLIREYVMSALNQATPAARRHIAECPLHHLEHIYVQKLVMVPNPRQQSELAQNDDCWSLMCFRNDEGRNVEFKFVNRLKRCYEFPTDSFQIILNEAVLGARDTPGEMEADGEQGEDEAAEEEGTVAVTQYLSCHHDLDEALKDLRDKRVAVYEPEKIRGGGFLRYIHLCLKGYTLPNPDDQEQIEKNQRLMLTRFIVDFGEPMAMARALDNYMRCHYPGRDLKNLEDAIKFLNKVEISVEKSTIHRNNLKNNCLVTQELIDTVRHQRNECAMQKEDQFKIMKWQHQRKQNKGKDKKHNKKNKRHGNARPFHRHTNQNRNRYWMNQYRAYPHTHMWYHGRDDASQVRGLRPPHMALSMG